MALALDYLYPSLKTEKLGYIFAQLITNPKSKIMHFNPTLDKSVQQA